MNGIDLHAVNEYYSYIMKPKSHKSLASLTVRNIPKSIMERLRSLALLDRRSLNNEVLVLLEHAVERAGNRGQSGGAVNPDVQAALWKGLCGQWKDKRSTDAIIKDIHTHRSGGRDVEL